MTKEEKRVVKAFEQLSESKQNSVLWSFGSFQDWVEEYFGPAEAKLLMDIIRAVYNYLKNKFGLSWLPW